MPRRLIDGPRWAGVLVAFAAVIVSTHPAAGNEPEFFDAAVRHLQQSVTRQRNNSHLGRLFGLRQLADPSLKPLFLELVQSEDWQMQVHALLGLAEINEPNRIDPWLITQVKPAAQEAALANAIDMDLITESQMREVLAWTELEPMARVILLSELVLRGETIDPAPLPEYAASRDHLQLAAIASLLLAQLGDPEALKHHAESVREFTAAQRAGHLLWMFEVIRQYEFTKLAPWVMDHIDAPDVEEDVRYWGILTLLTIDTPNGLERWKKQLEGEASYASRIRYAMLLLAAGKHVPASAYDNLTKPVDLLKAIVDAGRAVSLGTDPVDELLALIEFGHPRSTAWAMDAIIALPPDQAARAWEAMLDELDREGAGQTERINRALVATSKLYDLDPEGVLERLDGAKDDSLPQEVLLLGLFDCHGEDVNQAVRRIRRIGSGRADSLALLLLARSGEPLNKTDFARLGRIAAGVGRVSEGMQVQAAWLYLRQSDLVNQALDRVFKKS